MGQVWSPLPAAVSSPTSPTSPTLSGQMAGVLDSPAPGSCSPFPVCGSPLVSRRRHRHRGPAPRPATPPVSDLFTRLDPACSPLLARLDTRQARGKRITEQQLEAELEQLEKLEKLEQQLLEAELEKKLRIRRENWEKEFQQIAENISRLDLSLSEEEEEMLLVGEEGQPADLPAAAWDLSATAEDLMRVIGPDGPRDRVQSHQQQNMEQGDRADIVETRGQGETATNLNFQILKQIVFFVTTEAISLSSLII